jgi:DNA helicase IV
VADPEIVAEQNYLTAARTALRAMHTDVTTTETPLTSNSEHDEIWHNTVYRLARMRRAVELVDLPGVPLFFGRLDYQPGTGVDGAPSLEAGEQRVYVGRRHVHDASGSPMVVDWRARISTPFYRASRKDPQGVELRRRYGFSEAAELTGFEDETLTRGDPAESDPQSALLTAEIERPRRGPMRDIVATIQPEQDYLVRAPFQPSICVQGAPGTGKTAVGLHRLAYLLYTESPRLAGGVAVVGPNQSFLTYIRNVLPSLGEVNITQTTIEDLVGRVHPRAQLEEHRTARLKGEARMAEVLRRALWSNLGEPAEGLVIAEGSFRHRVGVTAIMDAVVLLRDNTRYGPGRTSLAQRLAHLVLTQMERRGGSPDDRDQNAVARSRQVKKIVDQAWPKTTPEQVLFRLLSDPEFMARMADGILDPGEQQILLWDKPYRSPKSARWSTADAVLLDELADLIERTPTLSHLVIDEAQDLSPMQCRALGRRCVSGSLTVLGDLAQGTSPWAVEDWKSLLEHLGKPDAHLAVLNRGFRTPAQILDFAARLLPHIAPGLGMPASVRSSPGSLLITATSEAELPAQVIRACQDALLGDGSVGLIAADEDLPALERELTAAGLKPAVLGRDEQAMESPARLVCVPASLAKGLEFDVVVVAEPDRIVAAEPRGLQRLYVVLTRAVSRLHLLHATPLPAALR